MQIKSVTDYALRMLVYLVVKADVANSKEISGQLGVPQKNVLSIGRKLKEANCVKIINGPYGGYSLAKKPKDILLYRIVCLFEKTSLSCHVGTKKGSQRSVDAALDRFYSELKGVVDEKLKSKTLADLIAGDKE